MKCCFVVVVIVVVDSCVLSTTNSAATAAYRPRPGSQRVDRSATYVRTYCVLLTGTSGWILGGCVSRANDTGSPDHNNSVDEITGQTDGVQSSQLVF